MFSIQLKFYLQFAETVEIILWDSLAACLMPLVPQAALSHCNVIIFLAT